MDQDVRQMGFLEHLDELRTRLIRSSLAIVAGMATAYIFVDRIGSFLLGPTLDVLPAGERLIYTRPGEGFSFDLDLALIGGCVLAAPFVMYQVWRFIAPGLYANERRFAVPFVLLTTLGGFAGALFNHYMLFPSMMAFFKTFDSPIMKFMPGVAATFELYSRMAMGMVLAFQLPTVVFFLAKMNLVTARILFRYTKYAILAIFILAAVLTPSPDPWTQTVFAAPMVGLYFLSIGIAWVVEPRRKTSDTSSSRTLGFLLAAVAIKRARMCTVSR